jgi:DNA-binding transcriptional regulator YiaG
MFTLSHGGCLKDRPFPRQKQVHVYAEQWHGEPLTELRVCRRQLRLSQSELAVVLSVPRNTLRMWDSGLCPTPSAVLEKAKAAAAEAIRDQQRLTLPALAAKLNVQVRTLQAAARTGRLEVQYSERSVLAGRCASQRWPPRRHFWGPITSGSGQPVGRFEVLAACPTAAGATYANFGDG